MALLNTFVVLSGRSVVLFLIIRILIKQTPNAGAKVNPALKKEI
ncbi:MAG: hypothetical protein S4CHLAM27_05710 [Chlamydiia bacterium]|nr:hypothetical protein [Chlamydiia bacterium]